MRKIRKCGYARVSTLAEEQEHSLAFQTEYYKGLIESDPAAEFAGIYVDKKSGKDTRHRPQFTEMIRAARWGEIYYIVTKSISRFARNLIDTLRIVRELREIGVGVIFEKESIDTLDGKSDFMLSIYATVAESELTSMGDNVKWAARKRCAKGSVEQNGIIYGYTREKDGGLIPIPREATVVKEIFTRYANGEGQDKIARSLNDMNVRKRCGTLWKGSDIRRIIRNEKYVGDALLQKTYKQAFKTVRNNGEVPQYYVENNHDGIVDRDVYENVRARIDAMSERNKPKFPPHISPFSGKLKCGECGKSYLRRKNNRNTAYEKWIWSCQTYVHTGRKNCGGRNIREKDLQALFLSAYNEAAGYESADDPTVNLAESIKALLWQERELISLKVKGYITREAYGEQHGELLRQIKDTEAALLIAAKRSGKSKYERTTEYQDGLVAALVVAEIAGYTVTFKFKNGATVKRIFSNDTDRKQTWRVKLRRI
jgi:DNA invertase Pin-like site-specific DNA recombinase